MAQNLRSATNKIGDDFIICCICCMDQLPVLDFPNNPICREKSSFAIKLWQNLCFSHAIVDFSRCSKEERQYATFKRVLKGCAIKLMTSYANFVPFGLNVDDMCFNFNEKEFDVDFLNFELNRLKSVLTSTFPKLWNKITAHFSEYLLDLKLYEFRKQLYNKIMQRQSSKDMQNKGWYPTEWLCFLSFGLNTKVQSMFEDALNAFQDFANLAGSKQHCYRLDNGKQLENHLINDFPVVNFPYNSLPNHERLKENHQLWQRLCVSYAILKCYRLKEMIGTPQSIRKGDYLVKLYLTSVHQIISKYSRDIPASMTEDMLCLFHITNYDSKRLKGELYDETRIRRMWSEISQKIKSFALPAWNDVVIPTYSTADIHNATTLPIILNAFRRRWWELQILAEPTKKSLQFFDPCWFPKEWLVFICFGPFSKTRYFNDPPSPIPTLDDEQCEKFTSTPSKGTSNSISLEYPVLQQEAPEFSLESPKKKRRMEPNENSQNRSCLILSYQQEFGTDDTEHILNDFPEFEIQMNSKRESKTKLDEDLNDHHIPITILWQLHLLQIEQMRLYEEQNDLQIKEVQYYNICKQIEESTSDFSEDGKRNIFYFIEILESFQF